MTKRSATLLALLITSAVMAAPASAQQVRLLGDFRNWSAFAASDGTNPVCFALSKPQEVAPMPDGYTQAYLYLTHRPAEGISNEFNLVAGFSFAADTPATLSIGGQNFALFTENDAAWLADPGQGDSLASAIRAGSTLVVEGTSDKGIKIRETFSLSGATAASQAIDAEC